MNTLSSSTPGVRGRASWHGFQAVMDTPAATITAPLPQAHRA